MFTTNEIEFLRNRRVAHLATANSKGRPHVVPVSFLLSDQLDSIKIGARDLPVRGQNRRYRMDAEENSQVALVVDDHTPEGAPRGVMIRGEAKLHTEGGEGLVPSGGPEWLEVIPSLISSWGIDTGSLEPPNLRSV